MRKRELVDMEAHLKRTTSGICFICEMLAGNPGYRHHIVYEDETAVVFLNKYPVLYGYALVAPRRHRQQMTADFPMEEYLALQRVIYRTAEAVRRVTPTERMYILSLGSQQGNRHVHWHVAPLPPGVPFAEQQFEALQLEKGVLAMDEGEMAALAGRIRQEMEQIPA
jgi:diadenosine tetraphosphate (Ap4A) HIT family hydrolase